MAATDTGVMAERDDGTTVRSGLEYRPGHAVEVRVRRRDDRVDIDDDGAGDRGGDVTAGRPQAG